MVSFIVPCFNEQDNVLPFYHSIIESFSSCQEEWHLVMIDDGSSDDTFRVLQEIAQSDSRVTVIRFSRNFGKEAALYAGLNEVKDSEYACIIDADLQQHPQVAREMLEKLLQDESLDCVAAYQEKRNEGALLNFAKRSFYKVFARASRSQTIVADASDFRVFRNNVTKALLSMPEYHRFSKGLFSWIGFNTLAYPYTPNTRNAGESKWSFFSLLKYAIEGILSFSTRPLHWITMLGVTSSVFALIYILTLVIKTLIRGIDVPGYASLLAFVLLFGGAQLLSVGVMGEYLARLYEQEKQRPVYIVRDKINPME